ncbi:MAG: ribosome silencing factor [Planctomycetes bacterium]|nr:ribosome silencing factor [Planctomycetota bacterium]
MAGKTRENKTARRLAIEAARIARDDNCQDVIILDLRGISPVTDYFVIATGTSGRQVRSVAEEISARGKAIGQPLWRMAGESKAEWLVMDFVDVVVHLFEDTKRQYYDLELIWGEVPRVDWQ